MEIEKRAAELARRTGVRVEQALALVRAGSLNLFTFTAIIDAVVEAELKRGECRAENAAARRREVQDALTQLAAAGETTGKD
jgi:hypothetical protein